MQNLEDLYYPNKLHKTWFTWKSQLKYRKSSLTRKFKTLEMKDGEIILKSLNEREKNFYNQIYAILNEIILPSLSMIYMNPCLAIEVWNLLKHFPYEMR